MGMKFMKITLFKNEILFNNEISIAATGRGYIQPVTINEGTIGNRWFGSIKPHVKHGLCSETMRQQRVMKDAGRTNTLTGNRSDRSKLLLLINGC